MPAAVKPPAIIFYDLLGTRLLKTKLTSTPIYHFYLRFRYNVLGISLTIIYFTTGHNSPRDLCNFTAQIYDYIMELNEYRLNSLEDPTDEMLNAIMEKVGISVRENSLRVNKELERRMNLLDKAIDEYAVEPSDKVMS